MEVFGARHPLLRGRLSVAPDWYTWLWSYTLTTGAAACVVWLSHDLWSSTVTTLVNVLVLTNQFSAAAMLLCDPGIYPRGHPAAACDAGDGTGGRATAGDEEQRFCRRCQQPRPPRASHCYVCNVCVLEHDHHCVLLGVCVGKHSQRWFVLYLLSSTTQLYAGMCLLICSFRRTPLEKDWQRLPPPNGATTWTAEDIAAFQDSATLHILLHFAVMALIGVLMIPITIGTVAYVLLPLTNTTWREATHDGIRFHKPHAAAQHMWVAQLCLNVFNMVCAGPSLVLQDRKRA